MNNSKINFPLHRAKRPRVRTVGNTASNSSSMQAESLRLPAPVLSSTLQQHDLPLRAIRARGRERRREGERRAEERRRGGRGEETNRRSQGETGERNKRRGKRRRGQREAEKQGERKDRPEKGRRKEEEKVHAPCACKPASASTNKSAVTNFHTLTMRREDAMHHLSAHDAHHHMAVE